MVTVADASKVYGAANPAFAVAYQGFVLGQTASVLGGTLTFSTPATAASGVGGYTVSASGLTSSNYAISFVNGTLNVTPAPLLVTPDNQSRLYGAANPTLTGTITGLQNNDPITATYTTSADATSDVGDYPITATLNDPANAGQLHGDDQPRHPDGHPGAAGGDSRQPGRRLYGAANPPLTGTLSGVQNGDAITASYSTPAGTASAVGLYDITAALAGASLEDYDVTATTGR